MNLTKRDFERMITAAIEYADKLLGAKYEGGFVKFYKDKMGPLKSKYFRLRLSDDPPDREIRVLENEISAYEQVIKRFEEQKGPPRLNPLARSCPGNVKIVGG